MTFDANDAAIGERAVLVPDYSYRATGWIVSPRSALPPRPVTA